MRVRLLVSSLGVAVLLTAEGPAFAQTQPDTPPSFETTQAAVATPIASSSRAFSHLFTEIAGDFKRLPSRDTAIVLGIGATASMFGRKGDARFSRLLSGSQDLHETLAAGKMIGGAPFELGAAFATYTIGRMAGSSRTSTVGAELIRAQVLAEATTQAIKFTVRRTRPDGSSYSFPSGHTSSAFASATVLQRNFGWKVGIPAYAVASYVAASRIQMKRHYFSDIAFGAALGIAAGRTVTVGRGSARFAMTPLVVNGGGGVGFDWMGKR